MKLAVNFVLLIIVIFTSAGIYVRSKVTPVISYCESVNIGIESAQALQRAKEMSLVVFPNETKSEDKSIMVFNHKKLYFRYACSLDILDMKVISKIHFWAD